MTNSPNGAAQSTFITINGVSVDAAHVIDTLLGQIAELTLALAAQRAYGRHLGDVLTAQMADPPSPSSRPSEAPVGGNGEPAWGVSEGL